MRLSDLIKKVEDAVIASSDVIIKDSRAALDAIKANHVKAEEPKVEEAKPSEEVKV
jgi:hypothetical protein